MVATGENSGKVVIYRLRDGELARSMEGMSVGFSSAGWFWKWYLYIFFYEEPPFVADRTTFFSACARA